MKRNNEKDIDNILNEYADAVGKTSDKSRDLGKLYAKKSEKREYRRPIMRRWAHVCVAAMLVCAILVSVPVFDESILHEYRDALFSNSGGITASSSSSHSSQNKGGVLDSISEWLESLKGDKGNNANNGNGNDQNKNDGNKNDGQSGKDSADGADGSTGKDGKDDSGSVAAGDGATFTFDEAIAQDKSAREFFKDLITPTTKCQLVSVLPVREVYKADIDAYIALLYPKEGAVEAFRMFYVVKGEPFGDYAFFDRYEDYKVTENEFDRNGITAVYNTEEDNGILIYYIYIDLGSVDCYIDLLAEEGCDIETVMTEMFG